MKKFTLVSSMAAGLSLLLAGGALAAVNPAAPNPYPTRESKVLADFESAAMVTSDPNGTGGNLASINNDPQFVAEGSKSLKLDLTGVAAGWHDPEFTINFPQPLDIKGYQVLSMEVFIPDDSISASYYQFGPHPMTTSPGDDTMTSSTYYGPGNMQAGWNHLIWVLKNGTDSKITQLAVAGASGADYTGPIYLDDIRVYKGNFVGLQPDEKLIMGFDKPTDNDFFTTLGDTVTVAVNTDKQFISQGDSSLKIDLTGHAGGFTNNVARADDWGTTIDASKATAIHVDVFVPVGSYTATDWHEVGFGVVGDGGDVSGFAHGVVDGQWIALEIPLTPDQAKMLTNVKGMFFITNSGSDWTGPIYVDNLRAVMPAQ